MTKAMSEEGGLDLPVAGLGEPLEEPAGAVAIEGRSPWSLAFARLRHDRATVVSFFVIVAIVVVALGAPLVATIVGHGVNQQFRTTGLSPDGLPVAPSRTFLFGTDDQGRDILVRVAYGTRISLIVGVIGTLLSVAVGAVLGMAAGLFGGVVDTVISRLIDIILSLPYLLFAIALVSVSKPGLLIVLVVISVFSWSSVARIVRGQVLSIREREYVEAARSLGSSPWRIMFIDIFPNVIAQLTVLTTLLIPAVILFEASLSFLGVGIPPPTPDWGQMISEGQILYQHAWWFVLFPSLALLVATVAFNIFGDGVRDALDPRADRLFE